MSESTYHKDKISTQRWQWGITVVFLLVAAYYVYDVYRETKTLPIGGEDRVAFREEIAEKLLDSAAAGLNRYYKQHGHYPHIDGKYFFDSIKHLVGINGYADSITVTGDTILAAVSLNLLNKDKLSTPYCFIAVTRPENFITYRNMQDGNFKLYWIGENAIDEDGEGDDIEYGGWTNLFDL